MPFAEQIARQRMVHLLLRRYIYREVMRYITLVFAILCLISCASKPPVPDSCSDMDSCVSLVKSKLVSNMMVDKKYEGYEVKIEFFLNDNAEVVEYKVTSESGLLELDNAGIDAIKKSSPFTAIKVLPLEVFNEFKHVKLTIIPTFD